MARSRYSIRPLARWLIAARAAVAALLLGTLAAGGSPAWAARQQPAGSKPPGWSAETTPNALVANGELAAEACRGPARCVAVGSYRSSSGTSALAESWNGSAWSVQPVPVPAGGTHSALDGVSCTAAAACTAVGDYTDSAGSQVTLAERWNAAAWSVQPAPTPASAISAELAGVSCGSARSCIAVGAYESRQHDQARLVESWNGTSWVLQQAEGPTGSAGSALDGVSCVTAAACVAVGNYLAEPSDDRVTLAEVWDGSRWKDTPPLNAAGSVVDTLLGVSCSSATACTAVGHSVQQSGSLLGATLAEYWNGSTWIIQPTPNPAGSSGIDELDGVSCRSVTTCDAVGYAATITGNGATTLGESWNGSAWSIDPTPDPGHGYSSLAAVSCAAAAAPCAAVGYYRDGLSTDLTLGLVSDGTSWSAEATPSPVGAVPSVMDSVSCASPKICTAVGFFDNSPGSAETLAEQSNGTTWTVQRTPNPAGFARSSLRSVSCTSDSACVAVGYSVTGRSGTTLAESWNGQAWTVQPAATTLGTFGELLGISCTSATACTAVGYDRNTASNAIPLAESWNGQAWTVEQVASPAGGTSIVLQSVSCTSASACTAVGSYDTSGSSAALAERWNGTTWTIQATPPGDDVLYGVSCGTPTTCTAVGDSYTLEHVGPLAEEWRQGTWHLDKTPVISGFYGVACRSAVACAAVGEYTNSSGVGVTLAEAWDGNTWTIQPTPAPRSGTSSTLVGVSPAPGSTFKAVGSHLSSSQISVTLAEAGPR